MNRNSSKTATRRAFLSSLSAGMGLSLFAGGAPAAIVGEKNRPQTPSGIQSGDVGHDSAVVWSRTDRPARMFVEVAKSEKFADARRVRGPDATEATDFTVKLMLNGLPAGQRVFYRVWFEDLATLKTSSEPLLGSLRTAPRGRGDVKFAWSGDTAGQGFGINLDWGGMKTYETMRGHEPDFFIHSGDTIYADGPIPAEVPLADGTDWKNLTTERTSKVAETLDEFRGNFAYNLLDENVKRFNAHTAQLVQWDDHETCNNWYPGEMLEDDRYTVRSCSLLASRGRRAFFEYMPIREHLAQPGRIFRAIPYGPLLDVLMLDMRTYRGPNSENRQSKPGRDTALLGQGQLNWLKRSLQSSTAVWKVIASDMPLGLIVRDGKNFEAVANGDGPALGRELEIAELLRFIKTEGIRNVVWLTADVHYAAAHYYDPAHAQFTEFDPFWEFVAGPLNAGTFGPGALDDTFGPEVKFNSVPPGNPPGRPPSDGQQFFGMVRIDGRTSAMNVELYNVAGERLYSVELPAAT